MVLADVVGVRRSELPVEEHRTIRTYHKDGLRQKYLIRRRALSPGKRQG
jgi:hypothetical protein